MAEETPENEGMPVKENVGMGEGKEERITPSEEQKRLKEKIGRMRRENIRNERRQNRHGEILERVADRLRTFYPKNGDKIYIFRLSIIGGTTGHMKWLIFDVNVNDSLYKVKIKLENNHSTNKSDDNTKLSMGKRLAMYELSNDFVLVLSPAFREDVKAKRRMMKMRLKNGKLNPSLRFTHSGDCYIFAMHSPTGKEITNFEILSKTVKIEPPNVPIKVQFVFYPQEEQKPVQQKKRRKTMEDDEGHKKRRKTMEDNEGHSEDGD